jgi:adenosylcobyric acid synthase
MSARPLFIGGTSSNAGKSWMTTAICAWLRGKGVSVAPFKAQNMSNHSYPCAAGGEIGRAQVAQAEACGLEPEPAMNPILLKPSGNGESQVIVHGRVWKTMSAREYYTHTETLRQEVKTAYDQLARRFEVIVIEGAGSVSELNLRDRDVVNLDLVTRLRSPWLLVADIERGGVFASVHGTVDLLTPDERSLFRGFLINRFRGDRSLFDAGVQQLEAITGSRCFGVFPYEPSIHLDAEDSLAVRTRPQSLAPPNGRTAIVRLPHLSNATDFRLMSWAEWISEPPADRFDTVILPGTKNTLDDLQWLRKNGLADWIMAHARSGGRVVGICGGYQMLGRHVADPLAVESSHDTVEGLSLLPVTTTLAAQKTTRVVSGVTPGGATFGAYEIHVGVTTIDAGTVGVPFATLDDGTVDGLRVGSVIGTYLHGALEHAGVCAEVLGVDVPSARSKADDYRQLGDWFEAHVRHPESLLAELGVGSKAAQAQKGSE